MTAAAFFLPALLQVLLTLLLYSKLVFAKSRALKAGQVNLERRALHADAWPENVIKINNNIRNQFEVPVLFYVLTIILWELQLTSISIQVLSCLFVATRYVHAWVHTGSNTVAWRRRVFMVGVAIVAFMLVAAILEALKKVS